MIINTTQYDAVEVQEYMGKYSVTAHKLVKGTPYPVWAKYQKSKTEFQDKSWPVKINLGDKDAAIATLKMLIKLIENPGEGDVLF